LPRAYICDEWIAACRTILEDDHPEKKIPAGSWGCFSDTAKSAVWAFCGQLSWPLQKIAKPLSPPALIAWW
jgi:hypothetical protein